jgi:hypothetical protein
MTSSLIANIRASMYGIFSHMCLACPFTCVCHVSAACIRGVMTA